MKMMKMMMMMMMMVMMASVMPSYHGGDGDHDPPPGGSYIIPADCQAAPSKKKRGPGKNKNLAKKYTGNARNPLPLHWEVVGGDNLEIVGENKGDLTRYVSSQIRDSFPLYYKNWSSVPEELKEGLYLELHHYFNLQELYNAPIPNASGKVSAALQAICQRSYRDRKHEMKKAYNKHANHEAARNAPPATIDPARWHDLCDNLFSDPAYQSRSSSNAQNRKNLPYMSGHGSVSLTQTRWKEKNEDKDTSYVELFERTHKDKQGEWYNDQAQQDYQRLVQEHKSYTDSLPEGSSSAGNEAFTKVFGKRRGYQKGVGKLLPKGITFKSKGSSSSSQSTARSHSPNEQMRAEMEEKITQNLWGQWEQRQAEREAKLREEMRAQMEAMFRANNMSGNFSEDPIARHRRERQQESDEGDDQEESD